MMKHHQIRTILAFCLLVTANAPAGVLYVDVNSASPTTPYTNWSTAATTIQDAVNAAATADEIVVTNGVYQVGMAYHRANSSRSRVVVSKPVAVRSVNGPLVTSIVGAGFIGPNAIRCVYLTNGAMLAGFTLRSGATDAYRDTIGAGVLCESVSAVVSNCIMSGNSADGGGGGSCSGTLYYCTLTGNSVLNGSGGGALGGILNSCIVTENSNGGTSGATLNNCTVSGNLGGGAISGTLNNCELIGNSSSYAGGGASWATLNNCTVVGNAAYWYGGGADSCALNNCIVYYNTAPFGANWSGGTFDYCCTTPLPPEGLGNRADEPQLAGNWRLSAASPCRGAGSSAYATGLDLDGDPWANPPSIGCDEYWSGSLSGALSTAIIASYTNVAVGFDVDFQALIEGRVGASRWDFGDGVVVSNQLYASHAWVAAGDYTIELRAYNETYPGGVAATAVVHVEPQTVHYVSLDSSNPVPPYSSWVNATRSIQDAVDAATQVGALVLVSNGVYQAGAREVHGRSNRVAVTRPVRVRSVSGPDATSIVGYQPGTMDGPAAVRCVYMTNGAELAGFTLTKGTTLDSGGGVWCNSVSAVMSNCVLTGNSAGSQGGGAYGGTLHNCTLAGNSAGKDGGGACGAMLENCTVTGNTASQFGGGAYFGALNHCALAGNSAGHQGGGAYSASLNHCTVTGNSARYDGGGAYSAALNNCIVYYNTARFSGKNYSGGTLNYCCTTPMPPSGMGNLTAEPLLAGNWHLNPFSPCRRAGVAMYANGLDLDGEPWASPPSIGCDEYWSGSVTGSLSAAILVSYTNVAVGIGVDFQALMGGEVSASGWDFGDGTVVSNRPYASHAWAAAGDFTVELRGYNESYPGGVTASVLVHVLATPVHYVALDNPGPVAPYNSWATAATNIQDAVDAAAAGGSVLVSNGVFQAGARAVFGMSNRVAVLKPLTLRSVNGPGATSIAGFQEPGTTNGPSAVRCVYLTSGTSMEGFTLTNGATQISEDEELNQSGGGVWCEPMSTTLSNCVLTGNSASRFGGGAFYGTLKNCALTGNSATSGGGADHASFNNCSLTANSAAYGGGASASTLDDCTLTANSAFAYYSSGGGAYDCTLNRCTLTTNSTDAYGGGARYSTLNHCTLIGNSVTGQGGGRRRWRGRRLRAQ